MKLLGAFTFAVLWLFLLSKITNAEHWQRCTDSLPQVADTTKTQSWGYLERDFAAETKTLSKIWNLNFRWRMCIMPIAESKDVDGNRNNHYKGAALGLTSHCKSTIYIRFTEMKTNFDARLDTYAHEAAHALLPDTEGHTKRHSELQTNLYSIALGSPQIQKFRKL